jgi:rhomboid protease GluP
MLQVVLAIIGAFTSIPIAFTAHVGGFVAGFLLTKVLKDIEHKKNRAKCWKQAEENGGLRRIWRTM